MVRRDLRSSERVSPRSRPREAAERRALAMPDGRPTIGLRREPRCPTEHARLGRTKPAVPATISPPMQQRDNAEPESRGDEPSRVTERRSAVPELLGSIPVLGVDPRREPPDWIAIEKPAGMHSVHSSRGDGGPSVEAILRVAWPPLAALEEAGLVHRLDRETSGVMLVAAAPAASARLRLAIADGSIRKTYLAAIAVRAALPSSGEFRLWFSSRYRRSARITVRDRGDGEEGVCRWRTRAILDDRRLLEVELVGPGRRHQIRAGFAHLGAPLVGDALYGGVDASRLALHAERLVVEGATIDSPAPEGFGGRGDRSG